METRTDDYKIIEKGLNSSNPHDRRQAWIAKERIKAESRESRMMRERLVEAHRHNDRGEIERIHRQLEPENKRVKESIERYYSERGGY
jgi:hypothetical protein